MIRRKTLLLLLLLDLAFAATVLCEPSEKERPDSGVPYPEAVPGASLLPGAAIPDWGYRLTNPGAPDNKMLFSVVLESATDTARRGYLLTGIVHGRRPWGKPEPAWSDALVREVTLEAFEKKTVRTEIPDLPMIHLGLKRGMYVPRVYLFDADRLDEREGAVEGVIVHGWNWTLVPRTMPPWRIGFAGIIQNRTDQTRRVRIETRLQPKPDVFGYDGPKEGYRSRSSFVVPGDSFQRFYVTSEDLEGFEVRKAHQYFDVELEIVRVGPEF